MHPEAKNSIQKSVGIDHLGAKAFLGHAIVIYFFNAEDVGGASEPTAHIGMMVNIVLGIDELLIDFALAAIAFIIDFHLAAQLIGDCRGLIEDQGCFRVYLVVGVAVLLRHFQRAYLGEVHPVPGFFAVHVLDQHFQAALGIGLIFGVKGLDIMCPQQPCDQQSS